MYTRRQTQRRNSLCGRKRVSLGLSLSLYDCARPRIGIHARNSLSLSDLHSHPTAVSSTGPQPRYTRHPPPTTHCTALAAPLPARTRATLSPSSLAFTHTQYSMGPRPRHTTRTSAPRPLYRACGARGAPLHPSPVHPPLRVYSSAGREHRSASGTLRPRGEGTAAP